MNPFWTFLLLALVFVAGWWHQLRVRDATSVDVLWSFALAAQAVLYAALGDGDVAIRVTLGVLGGAWGARLGWYLHRRSAGRDEDGRYAHLRQHWGDAAHKNFLGLYLFQALIAWLFGLVFWVVADADRAGSGFDGWLVAAVVVWLVAVLGEAIADRQLERFRRQHPGEVCDSGLWRYSRHPNYFFEVVHWVAYILLGFGAPWWWATLLGPVVMAAFVWRVSGIPWTEQQSLRSRGEAYRDYQRRTSALVPWPPKAAR